MKDLTNITRDDILDLRMQGLYEEANRLVKTFQEIGKKNILEGRKINANLEKKIYNFKHKKEYAELCKKYSQTDKAKKARKEYMQSDKGKEAQKRYYQHNKAKLNEYNRNYYKINKTKIKEGRKKNEVTK